MRATAHLGIKFGEYDSTIASLIPHYRLLLAAAAEAVDVVARTAPAVVDLGTGSGVLAMAAAIAALDTYTEEGIFENAIKMAPVLEDAIHSLRDKPRVVDIRNCGMLAAIQLEEYSKDDPVRYARNTSYELFHRGAMVRYTNTNLYLSPPLIIDENQIDQLITMMGDILDTY